MVRDGGGLVPAVSVARALTGSGRGVGCGHGVRMPCPAELRPPRRGGGRAGRRAGVRRPDAVVLRVVLQLREPQRLEQRRQVDPEATAVALAHPVPAADRVRLRASPALDPPLGAAFSSSAPPSGTQSPCSRATRRGPRSPAGGTCSFVLPTRHTSPAGPPPRRATSGMPNPPFAVISCHGSSRVPLACHRRASRLGRRGPRHRRSRTLPRQVRAKASRLRSAPPVPPLAGGSMPMTPRDRVLATLAHEDARPGADRARPEQRHRHQDGHLPRAQGAGRASRRRTSTSTSGRSWARPGWTRRPHERLHADVRGVLDHFPAASGRATRRASRCSPMIDDWGSGQVDAAADDWFPGVHPLADAYRSTRSRRTRGRT